LGLVIPLEYLIWVADLYTYTDTSTGVRLGYSLSHWGMCVRVWEIQPFHSIVRFANVSLRLLVR